MTTRRLGVLKTHKLFIGGKFPRSESGRCLPATGVRSGKELGNFAQASRKDFRDAVVAARKAQPGWAKQSAYLRGQILYRAAEMMESRAAELSARCADAGARDAAAEVEAAIDRLVHFAGWTDKFTQVFGSVNPVASSHFNFTIPEPTGVVVIICPDAPPLLPLVSLVAPAILAGNACVVLASETMPLPAITFAEVLATSDLPGGVVNLLTGIRSELVPHFATHMDVNAIVDAGPDAAQSAELQSGTAVNLKRYARRNLKTGEWMTEAAADAGWILDTIEFKTVWHPIGI
jgi:acyl-CoA reductase-like NAD-dependent aldehyde dehydrogenase